MLVELVLVVLFGLVKACFLVIVVPGCLRGMKCAKRKTVFHLTYFRMTQFPGHFFLQKVKFDEILNSDFDVCIVAS